MVSITAIGFQPTNRWAGIISDFEGELYEKGFVRLHVRPGGTILIYIFDNMMGVVADDSHGQLVNAVQECIDDFIELKKQSAESIKKLIPALSKIEAELEEITKNKYIWMVQ